MVSNVAFITHGSKQDKSNHYLCVQRRIVSLLYLMVFMFGCTDDRVGFVMLQPIK